MVLRDFCQKNKISRCRWSRYCGIAHYDCCSIKIALAAVSLGIVSKVLWSNTYKGEELQVAEKGQELSKWQEAKVTRTEMIVRRMITMM